MQRAFRTAVDLVDVAAVVALRGPTLSRRGSLPVATHVQSYWRASKSRHELWRGLIHDFRLPASQKHPRPMSFGMWTIFRGLSEEIFASDLMVRTWSCILGMLSRDPCETLGSFSQSVLLGQIDARHRLMEIIYEKRGLDEGQAKALDQLRRVTERWTDTLMGYLSGWGNIKDLAFDLDRARDFALAFHQGPPSQRWTAESLMLKGLTSTARRLLCSSCPHPELNEQIATSILASLGPDILDATGSDSRLWLNRLQQNTEELSHWLERLLNEHLLGGLKNVPEE